MDDIDDLLRRAMKSLDDQVPPGYFDTLATKTLARLEDDSMETPSSGKSPSNGSSEPTTATTPAATPAVAKPDERDEDSGLHDIRSLASSAKARAAARRSTANMQIPDEDVLANSTGSWKAVALPEPAKMVSLPELAELPSKREVKDAERAHKEAKKTAKVADAPASVAAAVVAEKAVAKPVAAKPAVAVESVREERPVASIAAARAAKDSGGGKGKTIAIVGIAGVAAAAAVAFVAFGGKKKEAAPAVAVVDRAPAPAPVAPPPPAPVAAAPVAVAEEPKPAPVEPPPPPPVDDVKKAPAAPKTAAPAHEAVKVEVAAAASTKQPAKAPAGKAEPKDKPKDGEPNFDDLLKEAGVQDQQAAKPKLEKKSLTGDDFKSGMAAVASKAQGCYAGTQGTATVRLTIAPTGKVSKVTVTGAFADTPVANCVSAAVQGATFPPWDGGPQTFGYSYLLSE